MKLAITTRLSLVAVVALVATGCATQAQTQASIGAGIGCAAGALLAKSVGAKQGAGCAMGAAVGGAIGYSRGRQADLELARKTSREISTTAAAAGASVHLATRQEAVPPQERAEMGNAQSMEVVDKMVVNVPMSLVARRDERAAATFERVGDYVSNANTNSEVVVKARTPEDYNFIVGQIRSGYATGKAPEPTRVKYRFEPMQRGSQASVEVGHVGAQA